MSIKEDIVELYWDDLTRETQETLINIWGDNSNYDLFPICEIKK